MAQQQSQPSFRTPTRTALWLAAGLLAAGLPAHALYKVVAPDGSVTFTDRPAVNTPSKVQPVNSRGGVSNDVALPYELRQAVQRFPVTLYTMPNCAPCDTARQLLRQRGVPFSEKSVTTALDSEALQRLVGGRDLPSITIGTQVLRGLEATQWNSYLDSAGYPKESQLPANFPVGTATPLTERREAVQAPAAPSAPARAPAPSPAPAPSNAPPGFRF